MQLEKGQVISDRYKIVETLGRGGMAIVYKAKCRLLNRYVAIKILRPEFTKDEQFVENFRRESQAAAGLSHPNIVSVYDVGQEGNIHFIVMELVEGKTLSELIEEKGRLDYKEAINITRQVASALSLAHKNQIVHRDIKPHNILITNTGVAKLADFGIAKAVSASTIIGGNNKVMGSVHYFSPEQARGAYVDERSDIYSLGIVLYEMLTGKVPFDGDNPISIALMHINDPMPSVSAEVPGIPPQLEKIIMKATDKYQTNRYRTADEMIEDLDNIEFITKVMGQKAFTIAGEEEKEQPAVSVHPERERTHRKSEPAGNTEESDKTLERANKISTGFIIGAVAVLVIAGIIGLGALLGWFSGDSEEIKVPNFVGSTFEKAQALAQETGLEIARGEDVYSPDQEEGKITSQNPTADSVVSPGKLITVYVSKGKKDGVVPKIVGMDYKGASEYLKTFGFELGIVKTESSTLPENVIIEQSVEEGSTALKGTKIDVTVSDGKGKETVKMPNLIGKTPDEANAIIDTEGLKLGDATYEETTTTAQNLIFWQQYPEGTELEKGTAVSYKVSKGEKPSGSGSEDFGDGTESADE